MVWDFWPTNYNPNFWEHVFGDCKYTRRTDAMGKGLRPSHGAPSVAGRITDDEIWEALPSKGVYPSYKEDFFMPRQSWFRYHGTGMHAAMTAVTQPPFRSTCRPLTLPQGEESMADR